MAISRRMPAFPIAQHPISGTQFRMSFLIAFGDPMSVDAFQVRFHPKLGVVIYDPVVQMGLAGEQIRLFKVGAMGAGTFMRSIVNKDLSVCPVEAADEHASAVGIYRTARISRRKPYCEQCRRHFGSVDFTVCTGCSAIRCTCGACSCVSKRRKAA
jgi:hypothetical protein